MPVTRKLTNAYDETMEPVLLLVLFMAFNDEKTKSSLMNFLSFYRENRALFSAMTTPAPDAKTEDAEKKEESPQSTDSLKIIEEYLKKMS